MSTKLSFDFLNKEGTAIENTLASILERVAEARGEHEELVQEWLEHRESLAGTSLADALTGMGIQLTKNKRDWMCLAKGEPKKQLSEIVNVSTGLNVIGKIAAGRFKALEPGAHLKHFDPRRNHQSVLAAFFEGKWNFFDWKRNKGLVPARRIPYNTWERMVYFHDAIDLFLDAPDVHCFQVTLNLDEDQARYNDLIHVHLESNLEDYDKFLREQEELVAEQTKLNSGTVSGNVPAEVLEVREAFIKKLSRCTTKQKITVLSPFHTESYLWYDPENGKEKAFATIRGYAPAYKFTGYEPVAE